MKPGDTIYIDVNRYHLYGLKATVLEVHESSIVYRYADDAEFFAGLRGLLRIGPRSKAATTARAR